MGTQGLKEMKTSELFPITEIKEPRSLSIELRKEDLFENRGPGKRVVVFCECAALPLSRCSAGHFPLLSKNSKNL